MLAWYSGSAFFPQYINKEQNIETVLEKVVAPTDFIMWEEKIRKPKSGIEKRHFKLFYTPQTKQDGL